MGQVIDITDRIKKRQERQERKPEDDCGLLTLAKHYSPSVYDVLTEVMKDKREEKDKKKGKK